MNTAVNIADVVVSAETNTTHTAIGRIYCIISKCFLTPLLPTANLKNRMAIYRGP